MAINNPEIIALQETSINNKNSNVLNWNIPNYNFYSNKHKFNLSGCGIYIKNTIIHREISLNTDIDCIAIEVINRNQTTTIVSIYLKPGVRIKSRKIQSLINQIKQSYILMGDFNSHNTLWGSNNTDVRGKIIEEILQDNTIDVRNTGSPTFFSASHQTYTHIDPTLTSNIPGNIQWQVLNNREFSDHYPILIEADINSTTISLKSSNWNFKKADWQKFRQLTDRINEIENNTNMSTIQENLVQAAMQSIPQTSTKRFRKNSPLLVC